MVVTGAGGSDLGVAADREAAPGGATCATSIRLGCDFWVDFLLEFVVMLSHQLK